MKTASKEKEEDEDEEEKKKKKARVVDRRGESLSSSSSSPPPYRFSTEAPVYFDSSAWSTIRQSFRIAVSHSTVFVCDRFLGDQMATEVAKEVAALSTDSRFLFVADSSAGGGGASRSVHLTEHCAQVHGAVDCMALLVYKLARFVSSSSWIKATVKITEFLDDSTLLYNDPYVSIGERTLKCLYFPTRTKPGGGGGKKEEERAEEEKCVHLRSSSENLDVRTKGDRLIAFWKDGMTERTAASKNSFVICITLHRRS